MGTPWGGLILKPTAANKAGIFDGAVYGNIGNVPEFDIQHFEITTQGTWEDIAGREIEINRDFQSGNRRGIDIAMTATDAFLIYAYSASSIYALNAAHNLNDGDSFKLTAIKFGTNAILLLDDIELISDNSAQSNIRFTDGLTVVGVGHTLGVFTNFKVGQMNETLLYELNSSGDRINELINLDWNSGDINTVPNIGADAPESSDMTWVPAGSGSYVDI